MILHFASAKKWNVRETFFFNQMRVNNPVITSSVADYRIGEAVFEVGGRSKGLRQIQGVEQGYIVKEDIDSRLAISFLFGGLD